MLRLIPSTPAWLGIVPFVLASLVIGAACSSSNRDNNSTTGGANSSSGGKSAASSTVGGTAASSSGGKSAASSTVGGTAASSTGGGTAASSSAGGAGGAHSGGTRASSTQTTGGTGIAPSGGASGVATGGQSCVLESTSIPQDHPSDVPDTQPCSGCHGTAIAGGFVFDPSGLVPVSAATVTLTPTGGAALTAVTNSKGQFRFPGEFPAPFKACVSKCPDMVCSTVTDHQNAGDCGTCHGVTESKIHLP